MLSGSFRVLILLSLLSLLSIPVVGEAFVRAKSSAISATASVISSTGFLSGNDQLVPRLQMSSIELDEKQLFSQISPVGDNPKSLVITISQSSSGDQQVLTLINVNQ
ncbi:MAG: hypothetical protein V3T31_01755 [candidate division Zixibacteria bacterium]